MEKMGSFKKNHFVFVFLKMETNKYLAIAKWFHSSNILSIYKKSYTLKF